MADIPAGPPAFLADGPPAFLVDGPPALLVDGPEDAALTVALAHGAGAPMDADFMAFFAEALAARGHRVVRFEFPYMAKRRADGKRRPPDRPEVLLATWRAVIAQLGPDRLVIGGKSMGGRIASMLADAAGVRGLVVLGYPFHAQGRPEALRVAHLEHLKTPTLILQGTRDALGARAEVEAMVAAARLSSVIRLHWLEDGDHSFGPRGASGRTRTQNWTEAAAVLGAFVAGLGEARPPAHAVRSAPP